MHWFNKCHRIVMGLALSTLCIYGHAAVEVGEQVGDVSAQLIDGSMFKLADHRGEVVMVNFWAGWCEPCRQEMPLLQTYYQQHRKEGFYLLAINMDEPVDEAIALKISKQYNMPIALRKDTSYKPLGRIWRLPSTFIIDKEGILVKNGSKGVPVIDQAELDKLVTPLLH